MARMVYSHSSRKHIVAFNLWMNLVIPQKSPSLTWPGGLLGNHQDEHIVIMLPFIYNRVKPISFSEFKLGYLSPEC